MEFPTDEQVANFHRQAFRMHVECIERRELQTVIQLCNAEDEDYGRALMVYLPSATNEEYTGACAYARRIATRHGIEIRMYATMEGYVHDQDGLYNPKTHSF